MTETWRLAGYIIGSASGDRAFELTSGGEAAMLGRGVYALVVHLIASLIANLIAILIEIESSA